MIVIITWSTIAWKYGLPTSESHALVAGLTGSGFATAGFAAIQIDGWTKVGYGLVFSTFLGFSIAFVLFKCIAVLFAHTGISKARRTFGKLQILSAAFVAFGHGSNDGQKFMGAFALALYLGGVTKEFIISPWVIILCATVMGLGTSIMGVGSAQRLTGVNWEVVRSIVLAWVLTFPVCGAMGYLITIVALYFL